MRSLLVKIFSRIETNKVFEANKNQWQAVARFSQTPRNAIQRRCKAYLHEANEAGQQSIFNHFCEQTGRKAFLMELDAPYCDVIVERWEKFTGKKAERIPAKQEVSA